MNIAPDVKNIHRQQYIDTARRCLEQYKTVEGVEKALKHLLKSTDLKIVVMQSKVFGHLFISIKGLPDELETIIW